MIAASSPIALHEEGMVATRYAGRSRKASSLTFEVVDSTSEMVNIYLLLMANKKAPWGRPIAPFHGAYGSSRKLSKFSCSVMKYVFRTCSAVSDLISYDGYLLS